MRLRTYDYRHAESILNANYRLKKQIERILENLELDRATPYAPVESARPHQQIQRAFQRHGWQAEALVSTRTRKRHHFDLYKDRVAIEIEFSNRELLYRDYIRFVLAESEGRIDVGVILVLDEDARFVHPAGGRNGIPRLDDVASDLAGLRAVIGVPIWVVALA